MAATEQVIEVFQQHTKTLCQSMDRHTGSIDSLTMVIVERDKRSEEIVGEVKELAKIISKAIVQMAENKTRTDNMALGIKDICLEVRGLSRQLVEADKQKAAEISGMKINIVALETTVSERWKSLYAACSLCVVISVALSKLLVGS